MYKRINLVLLVSLIVILSGCRDGTFKEQLFGKKKPNFTEPHETYHVYVNSINDGENHTNQKYKLVSGLKDVSESSLQYKEYANYVHRAMKKAGYIKVNGDEPADIGILFAYGIGEPDKVTSYTTSSFATAIPSYYNYSAISTSSTKANTVVTYTRNLILDAYAGLKSASRAYAPSNCDVVPNADTVATRSITSPGSVA